MSWIKNHRFIAGGISLIIVLIIGFVVFGGGNGKYETVAVERRDVIEEVRVAGTVEANIVSDLGFEASGVVRNVSVSVNDTVYQGQQLASLSLGTLAAELQSAQAQVAIKRAQTANTGVNIDAVRAKHDTLVENAYRELLSNGLVAEPQSSTYTQTPPTISGRYRGNEGTYKVIIKSASQTGESDLYVFDMEDVEPVRINKTGPTPLGSRGLFIDFNGDSSDYRSTTWYISIPNTKSNVYASNYSTYQAALGERDRAIDEAEAQLRASGSGSSVATAELAQAEAEVARIQALIDQRMLTAPFTGTITAVDIDLGESVSSADRAVSMISNDGFGVEVDLPEIDSIKVRSGNPVAIELEAVPGELFEGVIASVNRTETIIDGVSVYEARIAFTDSDDERIVSGMTADVAITTDTRENALVLPARAIRYRVDGSTYVLVGTDAQDPQEVDVVTGLRGSDGYTEILGGLNEGDNVIVG